MTTVLRFGATGSEVGRLTDLLVAAGLLQQRTTTFDAGVRKAVRAFQAANVDPRGRPLVIDGVVGELTWWALETRDISALLKSVPAHDLSQIPAGGSKTGRAALKVALAEMASGAKEIGDNNSGKFVRKYLDGRAPEGPDGSWCAGFVSWCFREAGQMPFNYDVGAQSLFRQFSRNNWTYDPAVSPPEPGDVVAWWRGTTPTWRGHVGIVHHCANGIVYTIEGNRGAFPAPVRGFDYVLSRMERLLGFGRTP